MVRIIPTVWSNSNRDNASVYRGSFIYLTLFFLVNANITLFIFFLTHKQLGVTSTHMDLGTLLSASICFGESAARRNSYPIKPDILEIWCHLPAFSLALYDLPILGFLLRAHSCCFSWGLFLDGCIVHLHCYFCLIIVHVPWLLVNKEWMDKFNSKLFFIYYK